MSGFRYYSKKRMYEKYMKAAAGDTDTTMGYLTASQAVAATREFERLWRVFTKAQKERFRAMRALEHQARGRGEPLPTHDFKGSAATDVQYWDDALNRAQRR